MELSTFSIIFNANLLNLRPIAPVKGSKIEDAVQADDQSLFKPKSTCNLGN